MGRDRSYPRFVIGTVLLILLAMVIASHAVGLKTPLTPWLDRVEDRLGL